MASSHENSTQAALEAMKRGFQAIPITDGGKRPHGSSWTHLRWDSEEKVKSSFDQWRSAGAGGVGLLLGDPSGGLVDIDLDHPRTMRMSRYFLPPTAMQSGRAGRPRSHHWYVITDEVPATRRYKMPDGSVSVELRSTGGQTVIPPSIHPSKEPYRWEGEPWGGEEGAAVVPGRKLAVQVALLGLGAVLLDAWPKQGGRHDAYLALAGGLLRFGEGVHPYWERNLPVLISALSHATNDEDGPEQRVSEVMGTTLKRLREGMKVQGFPTLAESIGADHAEMARRMAKEVESLAGFTSEKPVINDGEPSQSVTDSETSVMSTLPPEIRNPLEERISSWEAVDLEPYLAGEIVMPEPSVLQRTDGHGLFYPGRVNSLYGKSESAKSWIALGACVQEMARGDRVMFIDFEDEPAGTLARVRALGVGDDDIKNQFIYVHPEGPIAEMQRYRFGGSTTADGDRSSEIFKAMMDKYDPTLIVADGMNVIYGLHGHDTNDATGTDVVTSWLKSLTRGGRSTVIVIDHTGKTGGAGASPIGAHHKIAMVQGTALRADAVLRPMRGALGTVNLVVFKDRPGAVRQVSTKTAGEQVAGMVTLDSRVEGVTKFFIDPPVAGNIVIGETDEMEAKMAELADQQDLQEKMIELFAGELGFTLTTNQVMQELGANRKMVYKGWENLLSEGVVVKEGSTNRTKYRLAEDDEEA